MNQRLQDMTREFKLNYWKNSRTMDHVFREELAFSLIYNNINPQLLSDALNTVGLDSLPNYFFLVQIDDYTNKSRKFQITQEYNLKAEVVEILNQCIEVQNLKGFAANLTGLENVVCFLCMSGAKSQDMVTRLNAFTQFCKEQVRQKSVYTVSICISGYCSRNSQYAGEYLKMEQALRISFYEGIEQSFSNTGSQPEIMERKGDIDLEDWYLQICAVMG